MHLLLLVGGIYFSKVTKRNMPIHFKVTAMFNYVLHIGTRAPWNRFHNRHPKNQTICNRHTNSQRIFMWIQNDTCDLNNKQDIFFSCESSHKKRNILKPRNPIYTWFLETVEVQRQANHKHNTDNLLHHRNLHHSFLYAHLSAYLDNETSVNIRSLASRTNNGSKPEALAVYL